ncbi:MAG: glutamate--tRNA ligase [Calditrichaeota bacterium]|nr:glutamate--tRNA ligase [Calditrichota bacterium]
MPTKVITRFAPSPTGFLHVGGARTALFNFLYARKNGGSFRLRVEDTDQRRSSDLMTRVILNGLEWLGIQWNCDVIFQGKRLNQHQNTAFSLLEKGAAYLCFCTPEELKEHRKNFRYNGHCRNLSSKSIEIKKSEGIPYSVRFKVPDGVTIWKDKIHGSISFQNKEVEDFVILRSDRTPTYNLAVVADDHDMGITMVMRGDDHISNTPKQLMLYQALGWTAPDFAHIPLIMGSDGKRLSKRHGATSVEDYQKKGVLSDALFNFLAILGWSPPDNREILSRKEITELFSLDGISKKSAVFDEKKLAWMNQQHIIRKSASDLYEPIMQIWLENGFISEVEIKSKKNWMLKIIDLLKPRATFLADFIDLGEYFFKKPGQFDEKGIQKHLKSAEVWDYLRETTAELKDLTTFSEENIELGIRNFAQKYGVGAGKIIHPLRLALTGRTATPGLFEVMVLLGKEIVLNRLNSFLKMEESIKKQFHTQRSAQ